MVKKLPTVTVTFLCLTNELATDMQYHTVCTKLETYCFIMTVMQNTANNKTINNCDGLEIYHSR